jgi:hypothetical protein
VIAVRKIGGLRSVEPPAAPSRSVRHFEVAALFGAGVVSATAIILHGKGHNNEAYALGAIGALLGGTFAALRLAAAP